MRIGDRGQHSEGIPKKRKSARRTAAPQARDRVDLSGRPAGKSLNRKAGEAAEAVIAPLAAYPDILYPAVHGTAEEQRLVFEVLDELPLHDVAQTGSITWVDEIPSEPGYITFGDASSRPGHPIRLSRDGLSRSWVEVGNGKYLQKLDQVNPTFARYTIRHELAHAVDFPETAQEWLLKGPRSGDGTFGKAPFVSGYAGTNQYEDFAEVYAFETSPPEEILAHRRDVVETDLDKLAPKKAEAVRDHLKPNLLQRLADSRAARSTGRFLGRALDRIPHSRWVLSSAGTAFSALTVADGVKGLVGGFRTRSNVDKVRGALAVGGGIAFLASFTSALAAPAGLALLGAREGLARAEQRGLIERVEAPETRPRTPWWKPQLLGDPKPPARVKDRAGAAAAAVGGGVGAAVGGFTGPLLGILAGFAVGGPIGGAVGMVVGGVAGFKGGAVAGAELGMKVARSVAGPDAD